MTEWMLIILLKIIVGFCNDDVNAAAVTYELDNDWEVIDANETRR